MSEGQRENPMRDRAGEGRERQREREREKKREREREKQGSPEAWCLLFFYLKWGLCSPEVGLVFT